jgi:hypothetical protein
MNKKFDPTVMNKMNGFADGPDFEYSMGQEMADELWAHRKNDEKKMGKQEFFCYYVNTQLGLRGNCIGVKILK